MTLGQKIKKLRINKCLTQKELADQVYVTFQTVSKWENDENEPDVATLRELARILGCSLDYLLSVNEDDVEPQNRQEVQTNSQDTPHITNVTNIYKTEVVQQPSGHECVRCHKPIMEKDLQFRSVPHTTRSGRHVKTTYTKAYYHKACLEAYDKEQAEIERKKAEIKAKKSKKLAFGWGIAAGVVALGVSLAVMLAVPSISEVLHPALAVLFSVLIGYAIFADLYCIITGSYIGHVFVSVAGWSVKMPGVIFSWVTLLVYYNTASGKIATELMSNRI